MVKNPPAIAGDTRDVNSIPEMGRSPGGGNGNLLQYSCLGNPMHRGAWRATAHGVTKSKHNLVTKPPPPWKQPRPPPLGSCRPMAGPREGLCGGLDAQPVTVHRGPGGCTLDCGPPPWTWLCLSTRVPSRTLKAPVNTGWADFEGHMSVGVCLPRPGTLGPKGHARFTQVLGLRLHAHARVSWGPLPRRA